MSSNSRRRVRRGPKAVSSLAGDAKSSDAFGRTSTEPRLHSTGKIGSTHQLNLECLRKDAKRADRVTVVSGYYVRRVLKKLVGECRGNVRVILNGLGGRRLEAQRKELTELQESLQRRNKRTRIRLAFSKGIFHTKLYLFETKAPPKTVAWVGSANATAAALKGHNEEILLRLDPAPPSVVEYAKSAWKHGRKLDDCRQPVNSLHAFFRTGVLYYKPYAVLQTTFNPFLRLLDCLPGSEKSKLPRFNVRFSNAPGIVDFNIRLGYNDEFLDDTDVDKPTPRVPIRTYGIETCYGYWVAAPFVDTVEEILEQAASKKRTFLNGFRKWLEGAGRSTTIENYKTYLVDVRQAMDDAKVELKKYAESDLFESTNQIEKHVDNLIARLNHDAWCRNYSQPFVSTHVPELWDDSKACRAFEASFFGSLEEYSYSDTRPKAAKRILDSTGITGGTTKKKIQRRLMQKLEDLDWYDREFAQGADVE